MTDIDKVEFIQSKINDKSILKNKKIVNYLEGDFYNEFTILFRHKLETLYTSYCEEYSCLGDFLNCDPNGFSWEYFFDLIYNDVEKKYNYDILFDNVNHIYKILTQDS